MEPAVAIIALSCAIVGALAIRYPGTIRSLIAFARGKLGRKETPRSNDPQREAVRRDRKADLSEFSVEAVSRFLHARDVPLAISISPEGDEGSALAVMLARTASGEGRRTILIDMTGSGCPSALMAEAPDLPGLTDYLCGRAYIADIIHADRLSDAHIVPRGQADARAAMREIRHFPDVADTLCEAYDLVIIECGAADAAGVSLIAPHESVDIVLSLVKPDEKVMVDLIAGFFDAGFHALTLMTAARPPAAKRAGAQRKTADGPAATAVQARMEALMAEAGEGGVAVAPIPQSRSFPRTETAFEPQQPASPLFRHGQGRNASDGMKSPPPPPARQGPDPRHSNVD